MIRSLGLGGAALALVALTPQLAAAQAHVKLSLQSQSPVAIKIVGNTVSGRWLRLEPSAAKLLECQAEGSSSWVGVSGSVTLRTEEGDSVGTLSFNFPWVGDDSITLSCTPPFYGFVDYQEPFHRNHLIRVDLYREVRVFPTQTLPRTGPGRVRGRLSWDARRLQGKNGLSLDTVARRLVRLAVKAPTKFYELDPVTNPPNLYKGKPGGYDDIVTVGQFRWLGSDARGIDFELYDLPTDVPLMIKATYAVDPLTLLQPGASEAPPSLLEMFPPSRVKPKFSVRLETSSVFRGPLEAGSPTYDDFNLRLEPLWQGEGNDGSGLTPVDPATAKLRAAALSRVNPNPLRVRDKAFTSGKRIKDIKATKVKP